MTNCLSCGMPMTKPEEHGGSDPNNEWCLYCSHKDGTHKMFDEVLAGTARWMQSDACEQGGFKKAQNEEEALTQAKVLLLQNPAWQ